MKFFNFSGKADFDFIVSGELTADINTSNKQNKILILVKPDFKSLNQIKNFRGCIFTDFLAPYSHETLLLKDMHIPYIYNVNENINKHKNNDATLVAQKNVGNVYNSSKLTKMPDIRKKDKKFALTSTISGMKYYLSLNAKIIATRSEFILLQEIDSHPLSYLDNKKNSNKLLSFIEKNISFAAKNFEKVIYRFTDFSNDNMSHLKDIEKFRSKDSNPDLGNRGTYRLINDHKELFILEINLLKKLCKKYNNICILLPFVRSIEEAKNAIKIIRKILSNESNICLGIMVEVPSLIFAGKELSELCDFFVIGTKDLAQLLFAADRNNKDFHYRDASLFADLISRNFLPDISQEKDVYITSETIYKELSQRNFKNKVILLNE